MTKLPTTATDEERERSERLKRIKRCEEELQILRNLPSEKVTEWIAKRRTVKNDSVDKNSLKINLNRKAFVPNCTGPVASERVRIRERAVEVQNLIAQGRYRQTSKFPKTIKLDNNPLKVREPGAIRLTDLQQRMVAKSQKRQEEEDSKDEENRQELLLASESLSPRHRAKMRRSIGQKKSKAQQRYQRLLKARHRASQLLQDRQARQSYGIDERALKERQLLLKQVRALRGELLNPTSLEKARELCEGKSPREVNEKLYPIPEGSNLERTRVSHLQSLAVLRADKEWWRAVRQGEERDIRTCMDKTPCWNGWKNPDRLLNGTSLYGRATPPTIASTNGSINGMMMNKAPSPSGKRSPRKEWFIEPALSKESRELSDWWLNYALGALAESSEAERAIAEAREAGIKGKSFVDVLDRQTSKIVDYYKQQMNMEQEDHMKRTRLEEAEKAWEEQNALDRDTFMEQSLAATMIALEADFDSPRSSPRESPRGSLKGDDEDEIEDGVDLDPPLEDDMMMNTNGGRSGRSGRSAGRRLVSSLPPSALRRSGGMNNGINGGMNNAGRKTAHFDDDKNRQKRMNRTFNGASSNGGAYDDDMLERKTIMFDEESPKRRSPRENRRTSFMAIETIKETYDAIIDSPKNTVGNTGERLHKTMPTTLKEGVEAEERVEAGLGEGVVGGTELSAVKQMKRGHRRRVTVADATPRRQEDRNSSPTAKMSPTTETRHARKLLNKLFHNVIVSCEKNQINSDEYVKEEFFKCKSIATGNTSGTSKATDAALTYEQFMTFLINMETNVENTLNISIGIMEMPAERIDVAFSIFDVVGDLTITLESVVRFMRNISSTRSTAGSNGGNDNIGGGDEMVEKEDFMEEEAQTQFRLAIQQVIKGASWVARKDKLTMERVIKDAFVERDADGTGKVTTGQFAQIVYQLGIEMTRSMNESLLKELGVEASNQPNDRCVDYKKLIKFCETM